MHPSPPRKGLAGRRGAALILVLAGAVCLPFLNKPFHIDDPVVLHVTSRILENPLDPYSGTLNWTDRAIPTWEATTNPPLMSYFLAPLAALSNKSEVVLHAGTLLFFILLAGSVWALARRFCEEPVWGVLFVFLSPAVMVSGNVMRDIPAAALGLSALALFVSGTDRDDRRRLFWGGVLVGLAILTKYSMAVFVPLMMLYACLHRKYRWALWVWPSVLLVGIWCLHNQLVYGRIHILYLLLERSYAVGVSRWDKLLAALPILGSAVFLPPLLLRHRRGPREAASLIGGLGAAAAAWAMVGGRFDGQFIFWVAAGGFLLIFGLSEGWTALRRRPGSERRSADGIFLAVWFFAPLVFSILFTPFQAVRHLIAALPALVFLTLRALGAPPFSLFLRRTAVGMIAVQAVVGLAVNLADYEFAAVYRTFAGEMALEQPVDGAKIWYAGHWGWQFYAERAGFRALAADRPFPGEGDMLILVDTAVRGGVLKGRASFFRDRCRLIRTRRFRARIPIRTVKIPGTNFYSVVLKTGQRVPYRFFVRDPLETFSVYRVVSDGSRSARPGR